MASFKDLIVWQKAVDLSVLTYKLAKELPTNEIYGLYSQITRAGVSIPSNIAEGYRRNNKKEYHHFCGIALGSAAELETQLIIIQKVYPKLMVQQVMEQDIEVQKMLTVLISRLK
jgi:four helix bundle protein